MSFRLALGLDLLKLLEVPLLGDQPLLDQQLDEGINLDAPTRHSLIVVEPPASAN